MAKEDFVLFWGGTYSQWCPSPFTIDGIEYNCCEQYMMAKKALVFNDLEAYEEIMASNSPRDQKAIGRRVSNFSAAVWSPVSREVVYQANYAKFTQNPEMRKELMATGDLEIVEASPFDKIWGIGLSEDDPRAWDKSTWQGTNWLGIEIMRVRETIKNEQMNTIKYVDGDLIKLADEGRFDVIAHGCNCFCVMGAGIAPQIKNKYPEAYAVDCETTAGDVNKLGTITYTKNTTPTVVNIYSQYDTKGRREGKIDLDYDALRSGMQAIKDNFSGKRIGMPKIGAGLAGGDWDVIEKIIIDELFGEQITIVNYVP
jgi:ribA/ribD-fused uncharacterized protein